MTTQVGLGPASPLILVVDDDEDMRFLYQESLAYLGYRTADEADGEGAVEAALRLQPDFILMDVSMPGLGGLDATRRIKADPRTRGCVVIVLTGHGMAKFDEARAAGCNAFFCKPLEPATLAHVLRTLWTSSAEPEPQMGLGIVKRCGCGETFSRARWLALPLCGRMHLVHRDAVVELRNCSCGSSLAMELEAIGEGPAAGTRPSPPPEQSEARREKLFVVDRDPHVRRLIQKFVSEEAYELEFFDDGCAALDRARSSPPCALITEILIPRLDGLELCRLLKGDPLTQDVPILVLSMLAANERAEQSGADAFLAKPLEKKRLVASLRGLARAGGRRGGVSLQEQSAP